MPNVSKFGRNDLLVEEILLEINIENEWIVFVNDFK
jgi:hypothetical protein